MPSVPTLSVTMRRPFTLSSVMVLSAKLPEKTAVSMPSPPLILSSPPAFERVVAEVAGERIVAGAAGDALLAVAAMVIEPAIGLGRVVDDVIIGKAAAGCVDDQDLASRDVRVRKRDRGIVEALKDEGLEVDNPRE